MNKNIKLTQKRLTEIVKESIENVLSEGSALELNYYEEPQINTKLITEMARINTDESNLFPYNSFEIQIWSNDHTPPHFHILKNGWDVEFLIEDGRLYKVKKKGNNQQIYNYIIQNVNKWLSSKCAVLPMITNQQNAIAIWKQLHG